MLDNTNVVSGKEDVVVDQIFTPREIQSESYKHQNPTFVKFIDFKEEYDSIIRELLYIAIGGKSNSLK